MSHKMLAQLEVDLGRAQDAMARLIGRTDIADPELLAGLVSACRYCGLLDASVAAHERAIELDPKIRTSVAHTWFLQGDYARVANTRLSDAPYIVALSLKQLGRHEAAMPVLRDMESRNTTRFRDFMAAARALLEDNAAESIAAIGRLVDSGFSDPEGLFYLSRHLAHLGETQGALDLFSKVVAGGYFCYPAMARDPWLDPLRENPAFTQLLARAESQHRAALATFERSRSGRLASATRKVGWMA
jgi:tetratricopeptide (TPR) repeat protein